MGCKSKKYLHIHDWNYWWGYYRCGKDWEPFHAAEFSLSEDEAGEAPFFHFDFHNLPALHQTIRDGEFVEPDNPNHPHFLGTRDFPGGVESNAAEESRRDFLSTRESPPR